MAGRPAARSEPFTFEIGRLVIHVIDDRLARQIRTAAHGDQGMTPLYSPIPADSFTLDDPVDAQAVGCQEPDPKTFHNRVFQTLLGLTFPVAMQSMSYTGRPEWRMVVLDCRITAGRFGWGFLLNGYSLYSNGQFQALNRLPFLDAGSRGLSVRDLAGKWNPLPISQVVESSRDCAFMTWDGHHLRLDGGSIWAEAQL